MPMFQEVWAAELQIRHLSPHVDFIFIFEATRTFAGRDKFMYFRHYAKTMDFDPGKIVYIEVPDLPDVEQASYIGSGGRTAPENRWPLERAMRNAAKPVIARLPDDCIVYILDIDEFLSVEAIKAADGMMADNLVISFSLRDYKVSIAPERRAANPFIGGYAASAATCKANDIHFMRRFVIRDGRVIPSNFRLALEPQEKDQPIANFLSPDLEKETLADAGWHLSSMHGGHRPYLESKVQNFAHSESWTKDHIADARADQYAPVRRFVLENKAAYDYGNIDPDIPDFIMDYSREFPFLLDLSTPQ